MPEDFDFDHSRSDRDHHRADVDHDELVRIVTRLTDYLGAHEQVHTREREERVAALAELQRRLDVLNHAHEDARKKETDFQSKEAAFTTETDLRGRIDAISGRVPDLLTRQDYEPRHKQLEDRLAVQGSRLDRIEGNKTGAADTIARLIAMAAVLVGLGTLIAVILLHG